MFIAALASCGFGCAGPRAVRPDRAAVLGEGKALHVPIYIYSVSWSPSRFDDGRMQVGVADLDDKGIDAIELGVAECGSKGEMKEAKALFLNGPFKEGKVYASFPSWSIDYDDPSLGMEDTAQVASSSGHLVIRSVKLHYADGSMQVYDKNLSSMLAHGISNFCSTNPGEGNSPPSATIEHH